MLTPEQLAEIEQRANARGSEVGNVTLALHAFEDVPALLAEVKRLTAKLDHLRAGIDVVVGKSAAAVEAVAAENKWLTRERDALARRVNERYGELSQARAERDEARSKLHKVATTKTWTNEDGKKFVFVEDLAAALGVDR